MRELASGVYNMLKGTRRHAMSVKDFVDRVSKKSRQICPPCFRTCPVLASCMVREYGSPTHFLTLRCAEYDSLDMSTYLRKVNNVSSSYSTGRLFTEDPISVSRKFSQKFHYFFNTVVLKVRSLGR